VRNNKPLSVCIKKDLVKNPNINERRESQLSTLENDMPEKSKKWLPWVQKILKEVPLRSIHFEQCLRSRLLFRNDPIQIVHPPPFVINKIRVRHKLLDKSNVVLLLKVYFGHLVMH